MATVQRPRSPKVPEIRKGDTVVVLSGKDAGGVSVVVEGINIAKRHTKARQGSTSGVGGVPKIEPGGILDVNHPVPIGKVMLICSSCGKPTRIGHRTLDNGRRVRVCKQCGEQLEAKS
jgi:large subunit ribosomal protein L24